MILVGHSNPMQWVRRAVLLWVLAGPGSALASGGPFGVWNPLDRPPPDTPSFVLSLAGSGVSDLDDPVRLANWRPSANASPKAGYNRLSLSALSSLEYVDGPWRLGLVIRREAEATLTDGASRVLWRYFLTRQAPWLDLSSEQRIAIKQWSGYGLRFSRLIRSSLLGYPASFALSASAYEIDSIYGLRAGGGLSSFEPRRDDWRELAIDARQTDSSLQFPFGLTGDDSGWAIGTDLAASVQLADKTRLQLGINDLSTHVYWRRTPIRDYQVRYLNPARPDCCSLDEQASVRLVNHIEAVRWRQPMKWRMSVSQDAYDHQISGGIAGRDEIVTSFIGLARHVVSLRAALEIDLRFRSVGLILDGERWQLGFGRRPGSQAEGGASFLTAQVIIPL